MVARIAARLRGAPSPFCLGLWLALSLGGCGGGGGGGSSSSSSSSASKSAASTASSLSPTAALGKRIFADTALSANGQQACVSCHVPSNAFSPTDGRSTQLGGPNLDLPGLRSSPTLTYVSFTPAFHYSDGTAFGGFFRDGRSPSLANQATQPFVTPFEMANPDAQAVLTKLVTRPYKNQFAAIFGAEALRDANTALTDIGLAIAAYETEAPEFHLFNSKFDAFQNGHATLTAAETAGFALFLNPTKGNCAACHIPTPVNGVPALFTDFSFDNVGIPRNWAIEANSATSTLPYAPSDGVALGTPNYRYYDMGICGPLRTDVGVTSLCGMFKVPSLRNSALRQHYFHNGVFGNLNDVVTWYATRDTDPKRWYVQADGVTPDIPYNDLPQLYDANINVVEVPYNPALAPTLNATEINELVTFLCTLTDGYDPASPASYPYPAQCQAAANAALSQ